jgi:hypothetical protein
MEREGLDGTGEGKEDDSWCYEYPYIEMDEANSLEDGDQHAHSSTFTFDQVKISDPKQNSI